jgi:hypothetical protein
VKKTTLFFWLFTLFSNLEAGVDFLDGSTKLFSLLPQLLLPGEAVRLEKITAQAPGIDLSFASSLGAILFKQPGTYKIIWRGQTPLSFHAPWTLGFSLDGLIIFGNLYGGFGGFPGSENFEGSVVLNINAGQILRFVNASFHPVELAPSKNHRSSFTLSLFLFEPVYH